MPEDAYFEYEMFGPECLVCLSPIEDAGTRQTKFHPDPCGRVYRRQYKRLRERMISATGRILTEEELEHVRTEAARLAAEEVAELLT